MMDSIAAMSVGMSNAQLQQSVSISVAKKAMDSAELAAQEMLQMLPSTPGVCPRRPYPQPAVRRGGCRRWS